MPKFTKDDIALAETRIRENVRPAKYTRNENTGHRTYAEERQTLYLVLAHVSRSGMQREIKVYAHGPDGITWLSWSASRVLGWSMGKRDGVKVSGCGMDMGFHLVDCMVTRVFGREVSANDFRLEWL